MRKYGNCLWVWEGCVNFYKALLLMIVMFVFSKKATKIEEIFTVDLTLNV